jgi:methyl-accepting chemotaxis protein
MTAMLRNKQIGTKLIFISACLLLLLTLVNGAFLVFSVKKGSENSIASNAMNEALLISKQISDSKYQEFLNHPTEDQIYWDLRNQLNDYREKTGALYVYTIKEEDQKLSIMVDGQPKGAKDASAIGEATSTTTYQQVLPSLNGGTSNTSIVHDPKYGDYLSAFAPIKDPSGKVIGILGMDIDASKVATIENKVIGQILPIFLLCSLLIMIIAIIAFGYFISRSISKPVRSLAESAERMAEGDFTVDLITTENQDELGSLAASFNKMKNNINQLVEKLQVDAEMIAKSSAELAANAEENTRTTEHVTIMVQEVATGAMKQVESILESREVMESLSMSLQQVAVSTEKVSDSTQDTSIVANNGNQSVQAAIMKMQNLNDTVSQLASVIKGLGERSSQIGEIMVAIQRISAQTNLLSLNAAIEAARAGEHGRGFAVVAGEVRKLAEQSSQSAESVNSLIQSVQQETMQAVETMHKVSGEVTDGILAVNEAGHSFEKIQESVNQVVELIREVTQSVEHMAMGTVQVEDAIQQIAVIAEQSASATQTVSAGTEQQLASSEEVASSSASLSILAEELQELGCRFKV